MDEILECLVSPAPESFHILHRAMTKINEQIMKMEDQIIKEYRREEYKEEEPSVVVCPRLSLCPVTKRVPIPNFIHFYWM